MQCPLQCEAILAVRMTPAAMWNCLLYLYGIWGLEGLGNCFCFILALDDFPYSDEHRKARIIFPLDVS